MEEAKGDLVLYTGITSNVLLFFEVSLVLRRYDDL